MDNNSINLDELCSMTSKSNPLILAFSENNVFHYYVISKFKKVEFAIDCYRYESDIEMAFAIKQGSIIEHTFNDFYAYMPSDLVKMDFIKEIPSHHFSLIEEFLKKKHSESEERLCYFDSLRVQGNETSIFDGAKFGDKFITRNGKIALFRKFDTLIDYTKCASLYLDNYYSALLWKLDGSYNDRYFQELDIVKKL